MAVLYKVIKLLLEPVRSDGSSSQSGAKLHILYNYIV